MVESVHGVAPMSVGWRLAMVGVAAFCLSVAALVLGWGSVLEFSLGVAFGFWGGAVMVRQIDGDEYAGDQVNDE